MSCPALVVSEIIPTATIHATGILIGTWESTVLLDAGVSQVSYSHPNPGQKLYSKHKNLKVSHLVELLFIRKAQEETNEKEGRKTAEKQ